MKLLSVVVPVYNSEKTIGRCLKSIMEQTYRNLEIIVIDDGSEMDQPYEICNRFACNDGRIKLYRKEHSGVTPTRKAGVNMATGEYIAFVDSDDWIEANYFEKLMDNLGGGDCLKTQAQFSKVDDSAQYETINSSEVATGNDYMVCLDAKVKNENRSKLVFGQSGGG